MASRPIQIPFLLINGLAHKLILQDKDTFMCETVQMDHNPIHLFALYCPLPIGSLPPNQSGHSTYCKSILDKCPTSVLVCDKLEVN